MKKFLKIQLMVIKIIKTEINTSNVDEGICIQNKEVWLAEFYLL